MADDIPPEAEDRDHVLSEHHACPECGFGEFEIAHRANSAGDVIRCADEDCNAQWTLAPRFFSCPFRPQVTSRPGAEAAFLATSVAVWREIDRLDAEPDGYHPVRMSVELRQAERAAWEHYRDLLTGEK